jgi:glycosyltransferase involved in cell wall biosynthesis
VIPFFKTADIFLHTSNYEGYGMVLVEAAASNCAVVTTDVGIAGDLLKDGENSFICSVSDEQCISERIITLIEDKELRFQFIQKSQVALAEFVKEKNKQQYLTRYKQMWEKCID